MMWNTNPAYRISLEVGIDGGCWARLWEPWIAWCQLQVAVSKVKPTGRKYLWRPMAPYYTYEPCGSAARYGRTPAGRARACRVFPIMVFYQNSPSPGSFELIYRVLEKNVCRYIYQCHSSRINGCCARATRKRTHSCTEHLYTHLSGVGQIMYT